MWAHCESCMFVFQALMKGSVPSTFQALLHDGYFLPYLYSTWSMVHGVNKMAEHAQPGTQPVYIWSSRYAFCMRFLTELVQH